jgi:hypothetical protein
LCGKSKPTKANSMKQRFEVAFTFIAAFVQSLLPTATIERVETEYLRISTDHEDEIMHFDRSELDDLEVVLEGRQPVSYSNDIKNQVRFHAYIFLGFRGLIPDVKISTAMLLDERDWLRQCSLHTHFDAELAKGLYGGLKTLGESLARTLQSEVDLPDVKRELQVVTDLTGFYERTGNLNSFDARLESLSYLKAAAVCLIMELEDKKVKEVLPRVIKAYDKKICEVVQQFQGVPFRRIRLPEAVHDYARIRAQQLSAPGSMTRTVKSPQSAVEEELDALLNALNSRFSERRMGAWQALRSENRDRLSQAANSMVELLDQVIKRLCGEMEFEEYLRRKFGSSATSDWVLVTRKWIGETKSNLHRVKHHTDAQSERLTEELLKNVESILRIILG